MKRSKSQGNLFAKKKLYDFKGIHVYDYIYEKKSEF